MAKYDFGGWATKANLRCSDGRTITKDAFKHMDGKKVPLVWNHQHKDHNQVLGYVVLQHKDEGLYAHGYFNDTAAGRTARQLVLHGDVDQLSIFANKLKHRGGDVLHGDVKEVSLVLAGANPGAFIDSVIKHGEECEEEAVIFTGEYLSLAHNDEDEDFEEPAEETAEEAEEQEGEEEMEGKDEKLEHAETKSENKTIKQIIDEMTEEQQTAVYGLLGTLMDDDDESDDEEDEDIEHSEGGNNEMKKNLFDQEEMNQGKTLSHADGMAIIEMAKQPSVGSLKAAIDIFCETNDTLAHGFESYEALFPEFELLKKGEPETLERDQTWISYVMGKIHKSPISRIRTRHADARIAELRALGYQKKGDEKKRMKDIKLISRTTDPQTVYIKDQIHRDDIIDITDFDVVAYQLRLMRHLLDEELALAALIGDGREEGDPDKIHEDHIRSIWNDDEIYTIHADVDIEAQRKELQGTDTGVYFGDNYVYAEAIITASLYAREKYKGSGNLDLFCTPHLLNVMLLAKDRNGRRIYNSKSDLAAALNVNAIHTIEQFEGKTRTDKSGKTKKLLGLFVNMADYQFGSTKGGEITKFDDFDINFNLFTYLLETRLSGSLTKLASAIALEEPVASTPEAGE